MYISIAPIKTTPGGIIEVDEHVSLADPSLAENWKIAGKIHLVGNVQKVKDGYYLNSRFQGRVTGICSRCLEAVLVDIQGTISQRYCPVSTMPPAAEVDEEEDSWRQADLEAEEVIEFEGDELPLESLLREHLLLELPMKCLCDDDCAGLCPVCGCNLNVDSCDCRQETLDPRLAALASLLPSNEESKPDDS